MGAKFSQHVEPPPPGTQKGTAQCMQEGKGKRCGQGVCPSQIHVLQPLSPVLQGLQAGPLEGDGV